MSNDDISFPIEYKIIYVMSCCCYSFLMTVVADKKDYNNKNNRRDRSYSRVAGSGSGIVL